MFGTTTDDVSHVSEQMTHITINTHSWQYDTKYALLRNDKSSGWSSPHSGLQTSLHKVH